jgi:hypothetical protein
VAASDHVGVEGRADDKSGAGVEHGLRGVGVEHRAGTHERIVPQVAHEMGDVGRSVRYGHRDLKRPHAAADECLGHARDPGGFGQPYDGYGAERFEGGARAASGVGRRWNVQHGGAGGGAVSAKVRTT